MPGTWWTPAQAKTSTSEDVFMPWEENNTMDQRMKFLVEWQHGLESKAELCRRYGIARSVGYKWAQRYQRQGPAGLQDRSRAPHHHPNQTPLDVVTRILELRYAHRLWGAPKIRALLLRQHPDQPCPSQSTIGEILRSAGLTRPRARRRRTPPHTQPLAHAAAPHDVVSIDCKGWFRCGDGSRVDPLTVVDNASRYVLCCQAVDGCDYPHVRAVMETVFREHGPRAIGSDNGPPFATRALGGLSRLSLWWTKLGIQVERIRPARPSENGRQERFHLTLKQHTANPPARNRRAQQRRLRSFCREYNEQRPHQALQQDPPASVYQRSPRPYPQRLPEIEYEQAWVERKVQRSGYVYWRGQEVFVSEVLWGERVGFEAVEDGVYQVWFGTLALGRFDERRGRIEPIPRRRRNGTDLRDLAVTV